MIQAQQIISKEAIEADRDLSHIRFAYEMAYSYVVPQGIEKKTVQAFNKTQTELLCIAFGLLVRKYKRLVPLTQMNEQEIAVLDEELKNVSFDKSTTNEKRKAVAVLCYLCDLYLQGELFTP